jgi:hypothetical protein
MMVESCKNVLLRSTVLRRCPANVRYYASNIIAITDKKGDNVRYVFDE